MGVIQSVTAGFPRAHSEGCSCPLELPQHRDAQSPFFDSGFYSLELRKNLPLVGRRVGHRRFGLGDEDG